MCLRVYFLHKNLLVHHENSLSNEELLTMASRYKSFKRAWNSVTIIKSWVSFTSFKNIRLPVVAWMISRTSLNY